MERIGYSPQFSGAPEQKGVSAIDQQGAFKRAHPRMKTYELQCFSFFRPMGPGTSAFRY